MTGTVRVNLYDQYTFDAIPFQTVKIKGVTFYTDGNGVVTVTDIADGAATWETLPIGYGNNSGSVTVVADETVTKSVYADPDDAYLGGVVRDGTTPLHGATLTSYGFSASTMVSGIYYKIHPTGTYNILCKATGYVDQIKSVTIWGGDDITSLDFAMVAV